MVDRHWERLSWGLQEGSLLCRQHPAHLPEVVGGPVGVSIPGQKFKTSIRPAERSAQQHLLDSGWVSGADCSALRADTQVTERLPCCPHNLQGQVSGVQ